MSSLRSRGLTIHDPAGGAPGVPHPVPQDVAPDIPQPVPQAEWREWSASTGATSFRFPPELLAELAARAERTGLSQGQIALAGITSLLDESDEQLVAAADRAARALRVGRRNARRRLGPSG